MTTEYFKGFFMPPTGNWRLKNSLAHHKFLFLKLSHVEFCHIKVKSSGFTVRCSKLLISDEKIEAQYG